MNPPLDEALDCKGIVNPSPFRQNKNVSEASAGFPIWIGVRKCDEAGVGDRLSVVSPQLSVNAPGTGKIAGLKTDN
jgi:hypothetical protein